MSFAIEARAARAGAAGWGPSRMTSELAPFGSGSD